MYVGYFAHVAGIITDSKTNGWIMTFLLPPLAIRV